MKRWLWAVVALAVAGSAAQAGEAVFRNIRWPRHDKLTGLLEWELHAATAWPAVTKNEYNCSQPEMTTYRLVRESGGLHNRRESCVRADKGVYIHDPNDANMHLDGNVVADYYTDDPVRLTTTRADLRSYWDAKKEAKTSTMTTDSKVAVASTSRTLAGDGMIAYEKSVMKDGRRTPEKSLLTIDRNVTMVVKGESMAAPLPTFPGAGGKPAVPAQPSPMTIVCGGPLVADRIANEARFEKNVVLTRADMTLKCSVLTLKFKPVETKGTDAKKPDVALQTLLAERDVQVRTKDQWFAGDRFEWNSVLTVGKVTGTPAKPARMSTTESVAVADVIEFDQQSQIVQYKGHAEVTIDVKPQ